MRSIKRFVGELERPVQRIGEQFAAEVTHEFCWRCSRMKACRPSSPVPCCRRDRSRWYRPAVPRDPWFWHRPPAHSLQTPARTNRSAHGRRRKPDFPDAWPACRAPADPISTHRSAIPEPLAAAAESLTPSTRCTTQFPRFTGLVLSPGEFCVRKTAMGSRPPRP